VLALQCQLLRDVYEAARHDDPLTAEWPPSWMRLFSALVAVADHSSNLDTAVLEALEQAEPPEIWAGRVLRPDPRTAFVPTNAVTATSHATLVARTNNERSWARVVPDSCQVWFRWPHDVVIGEQRSRLGSLCRHVAYLGRSTSPAAVRVREKADPPEGLTRFVPRARPTGSASEDASAGRSARFEFAERVRCAFPGALAALRAAHDTLGQRHITAYPWEVGTLTDYGTLAERADADVVAELGPYHDVVVFELERPGLDGRHTARVTHAVRRAMLSRAEAPLPALHGHHEGDVVQCAFLGLPFTGFTHADGHLLGLGVAVPPVADSEEGVLARALAGGNDGRLEVFAGPLGRLHLRRLTPLDAARSRTLRPDRWRGPARRWVTALPIVLDRHLHRDSDLYTELRRAVINSRLPEPDHVEVSRAPLVTGGVDLAPRETLRRPGDKGFRPYRHARLAFPTPVRGPVVIGSMRHYGLGLCAPLDDARAEWGMS
jgi:CRISPR-associated protein Csb2